jgi:hypothetical protein
LSTHTHKKNVNTFIQKMSDQDNSNPVPPPLTPRSNASTSVPPTPSVSVPSSPRGPPNAPSPFAGPYRRGFVPQPTALSATIAQIREDEAREKERLAALEATRVSTPIRSGTPISRTPETPARVSVSTTPISVTPVPFVPSVPPSPVPPPTRQRTVPPPPLFATRTTPTTVPSQALPTPPSVVPLPPVIEEELEPFVEEEEEEELEPFVEPEEELQPLQQRSPFTPEPFIDDDNNIDVPEPRYQLPSDVFVGSEEEEEEFEEDLRQFFPFEQGQEEPVPPRRPLFTLDFTSTRTRR